MTSYKSILIYYKKSCAPARDMAQIIGEWLSGQGISNTKLEAGSNFEPKDYDCVVVLGGDGTILGVSRRLAYTGIPILGINYGKVGYLTLIPPDKWLGTLRKMLANTLSVGAFMCLKWELIREDKIYRKGYATNDFVFSRCYPARLIALDIKINGHEMGLLRSDGLIISTPLGSAGYGISAGGPLLFREMNAMALVPVCPFVSGMAACVVPANAELEFILLPAHTECHVTIDGQGWHKLEEGDVIKLTGCPDALTFFIDGDLAYRHLSCRGLALEKVNIPNK